MHRIALVCALATVNACASAPRLPAQVPPSSQASAAVDSLDPNMVPVGFGSLRQNEVALEIAPSGGLQVRAIPLDERVIRLLSSDSYRSLRDILRSREKDLARMRDRGRLTSYSIWYVNFFALEQGETRFSPQEFIISNVGRDFRPIDVLPLSPGFGEYRLKQREVQSALIVFDGQLDVNQPLTAQMEGRMSTTNWTDVTQRLERERAAVRSRASAASKKDS